MQVTDAINEYARNKLGHAMAAYQQAVNKVDVRMSVRGGDAGKGVRCAVHSSTVSLSCAHACPQRLPEAHFCTKPSCVDIGSRTHSCLQ